MDLLHEYQMTEITIPDMDDDELQPVVDAFNLIDAEREPRHADQSVAEFRIFSNEPGDVNRNYLISSPSGDPVGLLVLTHPSDGTTPRLLRTRVWILPEHRRQGLASRSLEVAVQTAERLGRDVLSGFAHDTVPAGMEFARAIGGKPKIDFNINTVEIAELDLELLQSWRARGPERAPNYSVVIIDGMYPEHLLEGMARLYVVLERDMPHPDTWEPREYTADLVRDWIGNFLEGVDLLSAIAIETASGEPVGLSQLGRRHADKSTWFVTTTMVHPEHRGNSLGKWVKSASCLEALERWPGGEWIETGNAHTNEPMLAINHAMGFDHEFTLTNFEVSTKAVRDYLANKVA